MIRAEASFNDGKGANCIAEISGNAELIAHEYAAITESLMRENSGQAVLDRAMDIIKKEINENEEKRNK